jgi:hypothetical protein
MGILWGIKDRVMENMKENGVVIMAIATIKREIPLNPPEWRVLVVIHPMPIMPNFVNNAAPLLQLHVLRVAST